MSGERGSRACAQMSTIGVLLSENVNGDENVSIEHTWIHFISDCRPSFGFVNCTFWCMGETNEFRRQGMKVLLSEKLNRDITLCASNEYRDHWVFSRNGLQ
jgi:hypothetical protein